MEKLLKKPFYVILPVILIVATTLLKFHFMDVLGQKTPFLLYTAVVIICTWYSGWITGIISNILCTLLVIYFFLEPQHAFEILPKQYFSLGIFIGQNFLIAGISYAMENSLKRAVEAEERFKLLIERACDLLVLRDKDGKATYVSPRVEEIYGYTAEEFQMLPLQELIMPEYYADFSKKLQEVYTTPDSYRVVIAQFKRKDGTTRWLEGDVYNYLSTPGINAVVAHIKDITERVNLEKQKDEFIGIASHELKTPITNIKGYNDLALASLPEKPEKALDFINKAKGNIARLQRLVNDLLDISKINSGQLMYNEEEFDMTQLIKEVIDSLQMHQSKHTLLFPKPIQAIIKGDRVRLEQVIINLLENAIKYSPDSNSIEINQEITASHIITTIKDFGIGIPENHLSNIFERFYRVDSSSMRFQGLGLGLFIASQILKKHGGSLWAESIEGKGSEFSFLLPLNEPTVFAPETDGATYYKSQFIEINYDKEQNWLVVDWLGYQTFESVQQGGISILDFVEKTRSAFVLNNNSRVKGNWSEASEHGKSVWFPLMEKAGVTHFAWVQSPFTFSRMAALKSVEMMEGNIKIHFFEDEAEAKHWLKEQQKE